VTDEEAEEILDQLAEDWNEETIAIVERIDYHRQNPD
jgi:hypothetical protein